MEARQPRDEAVNSAERKIRLVLIGNGGVGKSALLGQWCGDGFNSSLGMTVGIDYREQQLEVAGVPVKIVIWDTAGQERFWSLSPSYCRRADGVILVYDILNLLSFKNIKFWMDKAKLFAPAYAHFLLLGNKLDMATSDRRVISTKTGEAAATELGIPFFEISAKTGENVDKALTKLVNDILMNESQVMPSTDVITVMPPSEPLTLRTRFLSCCGASIPTNQ